jgi:hypothetical protein
MKKAASKKQRDETKRRLTRFEEVSQALIDEGIPLDLNALFLFVISGKGSAAEIVRQFARQMEA